MSANKVLMKRCSERDEQNNEWISKEELSVLFPRGYRERNLFSRSCEIWAMTKGAIKRKHDEEVLIPLSSLLDGQSQLQKTSLIGHSSDTRLFTELLQQDLPIIDLTTYGTEDGQQLTKKKKLGTGKVVNIINIIERLKDDAIKPCYICANDCTCAGLKAIRLKIRPVPLPSNELPEMPDIELIHCINEISLLKLTTPLKEYNSGLSNMDSCDVANTETWNVSDNVDTIPMGSVELTQADDKDLYAEQDDPIMTPNIEYENEINNLNEIFQYENPVDRSIVTKKTENQSIQGDSTTPENSALIEDIKKYFHLISISDIFVGVY